MTEKQKEIIDTLVDRGLEVQIIKEGYKLGGFYKSSGFVWLEPKDYGFLAHARYGEETKIREFDDLVRLNYEWWDHSKDRFDGWATPEDGWYNDMIRLNLIEK